MVSSDWNRTSDDDDSLNMKKSATCENKSSCTSENVEESNSSGAKLNARQPKKISPKTKKPLRRRMNGRASTIWFTCLYCKTSYVKADFKSETGDFMFKCEIDGCSSVFYNFIVFQKHQLTCPMRPCVEKFPCEVCGKHCSSFRTLERHSVLPYKAVWILLRKMWCRFSKQRSSEQAHVVSLRWETICLSGVWQIVQEKDAIKIPYYETKKWSALHVWSLWKEISGPSKIKETFSITLGPQTISVSVL